MTHGNNGEPVNLMEREPIEFIEQVDSWADFLLDQGALKAAKQMKELASELVMSWDNVKFKKAVDLIEWAKDFTGVDIE